MEWNAFILRAAFALKRYTNRSGVRSCFSFSKQLTLSLSLFLSLSLPDPGYLVPCPSNGAQCSHPKIAKNRTITHCFASFRRQTGTMAWPCLAHRAFCMRAARTHNNSIAQPNYTLFCSCGSQERSFAPSFLLPKSLYSCATRFRRARTFNSVSAPS